MNREIKFKFYIFCKDGILVDIQYATLDEIIKDDEIKLPKGYTYISKQYTGLQDKNGVEIYESDVVTFKYTSGNYQKATIKWNNEKASYDFVGKPILNYSYNFRQINNIEVISNIYENPKLITN